MARPVNRRKVVIETLDRAARPLYLLDADRRIVYCNPACLDWLAVSEADVVGQRVDYHSDPTSERSRWAGLCPSPRALAGDVGEGVVWFAPNPLTIVKHSARFFPLPLADQAMPRILVAVGHSLDDGELVPDDVPTRNAARLHEQLLRYTTGVEAFLRVDPLVGISPLIKRVRAQVRLAAREADRVLIVGPAGCGHEVVARSIHEGFRRQGNSRLFPLDCSLLDAELLQTAVDAFIRRAAEVSERGVATLLLLDADQLALDAQQSLLGLISGATLKLRTIATASSELIHGAAFRPDLAAALSTLTIRLPALAERLEDLPLLVQWLLERMNRQAPRQLEGVTPEALDQLLNHPWRGNLDELADVVESARQKSTSSMLGTADLPRTIGLSADAERFPAIRPTTIQLDEYLGAIERELIERALRMARGNRAEAARLLGIQRARLLRRLAALGFDT